jgi:hypothetical protein
MGLIADAQTAPANGLVQVPSSRAVLAYVRPGTDWSKYRTVLIDGLRIPTTIREDAGKGKSTRFRESYVLRDEDVAALQSDYDKAMRDALSKAGYSFVTTPGADTLVIAAQIVDLRLNAPVESSRLSYSSRGRVYSRGAGSMSVGAVLADGPTWQVLAQIGARSYSADVWQINNSTTNRAEARRAFNKWARALSDRLVERRTAAR